MFKIFTDGEREKIINIAKITGIEISDFNADFKLHVEIGEGVEVFSLKDLNPEAKSAFLECLAHTLRKSEGDGGIVFLDWFVGRANELSADTALKGGEDD